MLLAALLALAPNHGRAQSPKKSEPTKNPQTKGAIVKDDAAKTGKCYTPEERQAYEKKAAEALAGIDEKVADLRMKARKAAPQQKRMMVLATNNLYAQTVTARNQLAALKKTPENDWSGARAEVDKTMVELGNTVAALEMQLK
jgi:hypothetical protein